MNAPRRNAPCPCGSGLRYKACCGRLEGTARAALDAKLRGALDLHQSGRLAEAEALYLEVLQDDPGHAEARHFLGLLMHQSGKAQRAVQLIGEALAAAPTAQMHCNLGVVLQAGGRLDEAQASYASALALEPDFADAHLNLGLLLNRRNRFAEALRHLRRLIEMRPANAEAHAHLAAALSGAGDREGALASYHTALRLDSRFAGAYNNLGLLLRQLGRPERAEAAFRDAIAADPAFAEARVNLALLLFSGGSTSEARSCLGEAFKIRPGHAGTYSNLLFLEAYDGSLSSEDYLALARGWEKACVPDEARAEAAARTFPRRPPGERKLRIGYVSGDFRDHAVSHFIKPVIARHDRERFEISCYSTSGGQDAFTDEFIALSDRWVSLVGMPDSAAAEQIRADGIDVLMDLSGHTEHCRPGVFALRAAPVQCHYLGFMASTGLSEMDYWIGDGLLIPPQLDDAFAETIWRLPRVWVSYEGNAAAPSPAWQPDPSGAIRLGSFNALPKLTPPTLALWARVLRALPASRLVLKTAELSDPRQRARLTDALAAEGIGAERVTLLDRSASAGWRAHMALYDGIDICLDPIGAVGGGTTTCDALWMSVPVITLAGERMGSRMSVSMLRAIDREEWVAATPEEYVQCVLRLAGDAAALAKARNTLRQSMAASPLCDSKDLARRLEEAYGQMYSRRRRF